MHKMFNIKDISGKCGQAVRHAGDFLPYAQQKLGFNKPVGVNFVSDMENAKDPFGKTAYYDPNKMEITVYVDKRHVKDILRSLSHELVHHTQNCRGEFDREHETGPGYAQRDPHMRKMEAEAYLLGNGFLFRDYEDQLKEKKTMGLKLDENKANEGMVYEPGSHKSYSGTKPTDKSLSRLKMTRTKPAGDVSLPPKKKKPADLDKLQTEEEMEMVKHPKTGKMVPKFAVDGEGPNDELSEGDNGDKKPNIGDEKKPNIGDEKKKKKPKKREGGMTISRPGDMTVGLEEGDEVSEELGPKVATHKGKAVKKIVSRGEVDTHPAYDTPQAKRARQGKGKLTVEPEKKKNENWAKGDKHELLFERLVKKWAK